MTRRGDAREQKPPLERGLGKAGALTTGDAAVSGGSRRAGGRGGLGLRARPQPLCPTLEEARGHWPSLIHGSVRIKT